MHRLMVTLVYPEACLELGRKALEGNQERLALRQALRRGSGEPQDERLGGTHFNCDTQLVLRHVDLYHLASGQKYNALSDVGSPVRQSLQVMSYP